MEISLKNMHIHILLVKNFMKLLVMIIVVGTFHDRLVENHSISVGIFATFRYGNENDFVANAAIPWWYVCKMQFGCCCCYCCVNLSVFGVWERERASTWVDNRLSSKVKQLSFSSGFKNEHRERKINTTQYKKRIFVLFAWSWKMEKGTERALCKRISQCFTGCRYYCCFRYC